jgi:hypothetical protein
MSGRRIIFVRIDVSRPGSKTNFSTKSSHMVRLAKSGSRSSPGLDAHSILSERLVARVKFAPSISRKSCRRICPVVANAPISNPRERAASLRVLASPSARAPFAIPRRHSADIGAQAANMRRLSIFVAPRRWTTETATIYRVELRLSHVISDGRGPSAEIPIRRLKGERSPKADAPSRLAAGRSGLCSTSLIRR